MTKIVVASNNAYKIKEIKAILKSTNYEILSLKEAGIVADPDENSDTFEGNAIIKATAISEQTRSMVIADDSGLLVDCLNGKPGVRSKRFAGVNASDTDNNEYLISILKATNSEKFSARFICVIALIDVSGSITTFKGTCEGEIVLAPVGSNGFGYDPYFYLPELGKTMAQLTDEEKNSISHRGKALSELKKYFDLL